MERHTLLFNDFAGLVLLDALDRECRVLDLVTTKEREAGNRDGWALARIKYRVVRDLLGQTVQGLPHVSGEGWQLRPEDATRLAKHIAAVGLKMKPPSVELEEQATVKARMRDAVRRAKPVGTDSGASVAVTSPAPPRADLGKLLWKAPKVE